MLTADLVKVRRRKGKLRPVYLTDYEKKVWAPVLQKLIATFEQHVGKSAKLLDDETKRLVERHSDRIRAAGFIKLLRDRCEFDTAKGLEAAALRERVFALASKQRERLGIDETFDRDEVLRKVAENLQTTPENIEASLFADLPGEQPLLKFDPITPTQLLQRYDMALAQGVLLKAIRVDVHLDPCPAPRLRQIFRSIKFRRLMHQVRGSPDQGYDITLDGPMSLFESTQRYGLQLALFLPTLVAGDGWKLEAQVLWGKDKKRLVFELDDQAGLVSHLHGADGLTEEVEALVRAFRRLDTPWTVRREARIFRIGASGLFVPDLVFRHPDRHEKVYLETFGYWSRKAVFDRVEMLDGAMSDRFLLAVSKKLRVSAEIADQDFPGEVLVYSQSISARSVVKALERVSAPRGTRTPQK